MIKYQIYKFEELDVENHWIHFAGFGTNTSSTQHYAEDYNHCDLRLNPEEVYQISMDQSTSNTGIFIKNFKNTEAYMIEVSRKRGEDAGDFIYQLEMFLHQLCDGCNISHIVYECPIKTKSYRSAQVLFQLEGAIRALGKRYTEFKTAKIDNIENAAWRAAVIDKTLDSSYNRKQLSRLSIQKVFPWTQDYGSSLGSDEDVYEAICIMMGWFLNSFDHLGRPYVRGQRGTRTVGGFCLPTLPAEQVVEMLKAEGIEAQFAVENPKYSIYQNLVSMVERYKVLCVEFNTKYSMLCMCVECNMKWTNPDVMTLILVDAATVDTNLKNITGGEFHFVI